MAQKSKLQTSISLRLKELSWIIIMCRLFAHQQEALYCLEDIQYTQVCVELFIYLFIYLQKKTFTVVFI